MDFARLSKSSIIQLIGVTPNQYYFEDVIKTSKVQILSEQCAMCPEYAMSPQICDCEHFCEHCKNCPHYQFENIHVTEKQKKYRNERKKFGKRAKQGASSIKVLISLHFSHPDNMGLVTTSVKNITEQTGLNKRQVKYALKKLQEQQYISYSAAFKNWNDEFMIMITDYNKMHLPASEGGTGYITFSTQNLAEIREIRKVNELRTYLRLYINCDETAVKKKDANEAKAKVSRRSMKTWLPEYLTFGQIDNLIQKAKKYFNVSSETDSENVHVEISPEANGRLVYACKLQEATEDVSALIEEVNSLVTYKDNELTRTNDILKMQELGILDGTRQNWENKVVLFSDERNLIDLAKLVVEYGFGKVKSAICDIIKQYHFKDQKIFSWGALARKIIQLDLSFE